jgi:hypothetical protein
MISYERPSHERACPRCGDVAHRIRRRLVDRLLSLFHPVYRFRCARPSCGWTGNLRQTVGNPADSPGRGSRGDAAAK